VEKQLQQISLIDPSFLASGWNLTVLNDRRHAGRDTIQVRATRLSSSAGDALWEYVDEYEVSIDQERGVILRYAGIVDGEEAGVFSVRSVRFDEAIPDEIFSYEPPDGTKTVWAEP
jgi:outer membrane lipoprotein-sorting protein